jgi:hemerythrin
MNTSAGIFETDASDLRSLNEEHAEIRRRYHGLERVILRGGSMPRILAAADNFVQMMLLHFTHEECFLVKLSLYGLQTRHREAKKKITTQILDIETELEQRKASAVFQLLRLGKVWMKEHMHPESEEFEGENLIDEERHFLARRVLTDHLVATGTRGPHHPSPRVRHAHVRG